MTNKFHETAARLQSAGIKPSAEGLSGQLAEHFEKTAELFDEVTLMSMTGLPSSAMQEVAISLRGVAEAIRAGFAGTVIHDKETFLAALCGQGITADGIAYCAGLDKDGADNAIIAYLASGEMAVAPDLTPFVPAEVEAVDAEVPHVPV